MTPQEWLAISQAVLTAVIGAITTYIAWQQWNGNKLKLRLDRYEKRLRIYQDVVRVLSIVLREASIKLEELMMFRANTAEAVFLFGPEIPKYIGEIFSHGLALRTANEQYRDAYQEKPSEYDHAKVVSEMHKNLTWLTEQFEPAKVKFSKYLHVGD